MASIARGCAGHAVDGAGCQPTRRTPRTRQQHRNQTPASETVEDTPPEEPVESAEEDTKISSDLDDCPELWKSELGYYIIETHKRQKQVDAWFSRWIIVRTRSSPFNAQLAKLHTGARLDHCVPDVPPLQGQTCAHTPSSAASSTAACTGARPSVSCAITVF